MPFENEWVAVTLLAALQAGIRSALDAVEARWEARGDPLTLPSPVTWHRGAEPVIFELEAVDFPYVAIQVPRRAPVEGSGSDQPGFGEQTIEVWIDSMLVDDTVEIVNSLSLRYAEALTALLAENWNVAGYEQVDQEPTFDQSVVYVHGETLQSDMQRPAQVKMMQGSRIIQRLRG